MGDNFSRPDLVRTADSLGTLAVGNEFIAGDVTAPSGPYGA